MRAEGTNSEIVERYAEVMKQNDPDGWSVFPEIKILEDTSEGLKDQGRDDGQWLYDRYLLAGFHRLEAMKKCGYDEIRAVMIAGNRLDGLIIAAGENADRSQPRTQEDIKTMMEFCLTHPEISLWSNGQIARWCAVSRQTVNNHENRLLSTSNLDIDTRPNELKFIDKHGNISRRKRLITKEEKTIGDGLLINPKGEVVDAASVVNAELDAEQVESEQLQRDITNTFISSIRPVVFSTHPTIFAQREAALIEEYPLLELYPRLPAVHLHVDDHAPKLYLSCNLLRLLNDIIPVKFFVLIHFACPHSLCPTAVHSPLLRVNPPSANSSTAAVRRFFALRVA